MYHAEVVQMFQEAADSDRRREASRAADRAKNEAESAGYGQALLQLYKDRWDEEIINFDLIMQLLHLIEQENLQGAVLIFLPGYEDILAVRDRILSHDVRFPHFHNFEVTTIKVQRVEQLLVFWF